MIGLRHVTNFKSCYNNLKLLNLSKRLCTVVNTLPYDAYTLKMPTMMDSFLKRIGSIKVSRI